MTHAKIHLSGHYTFPFAAHIPHKSGETHPVCPQVLVMAARGRDSLTPFQHARLTRVARVEYRTVLQPLSTEEFIKAAGEFDYVAITRRAIQRLDRSILERLPKLKGLSVYSTGTEWIDTEAVQRQGIRLASLPDYCTNAVAETALGLLLLSAHKLHLRYLKSIQAVPEHVSLRGRELQSGTVGIIGQGRIGSLLAQKLQSLCAHTLVHDTDLGKLGVLPQGARIAGKREILRRADWVVCCASQDFEENPLLAETDYALLRPETTLINVARTSLFDHERLVQMVQDRRLGAYFYDDILPVGEEPDKTEYGKIVPLGHTAWYTDEALKAGTEQWVENVLSLVTNCFSNQKIQFASC